MRFLLPRRFKHISTIFLACFTFSLYLLTANRPDNRNDDSVLVESNVFSWRDDWTLQCSFDGKKHEDVIPELSRGRARHDDRRMVRIYDFLIIGKEWERLLIRYDVCLSTQTSIERIYWLPQILDTWTGPLSLGVHLVSEEEWLIFNLYLCYLSQCHPRVNQVSIHLAIPTGASLKVSEFKLNRMNFTRKKLERIQKFGKSCPQAKTYLNFLLDNFPTLSRRRLKLKELYPQNHMRNIARKACGTSWTYSADIDLIPSIGMADKLQQFYTYLEAGGNVCEKCAYVIPVFELNETYLFPKSKLDLNRLYNLGAARQFHLKKYRYSHLATDYPKWIFTNLAVNSTIISHKVDRRFIKPQLHYEPFYVSPDSIISFDERFIGYGYTRYSQFIAAYTAGWNFTVLSPVFSIHWGLQTAKTQLSPKKDGIGKPVRNLQVKRNMGLFNTYIEEINHKMRLGIL